MANNNIYSYKTRGITKYGFQIYLNGKHTRHQGFMSKIEAKNVYRQLKIDEANGLLQDDKKKSSKTFKDFTEQYLALKKRSLAPVTYNKLVKQINTHLLTSPLFQNKVENIKPADVQQFVINLSDQIQTFKRISGVAKAILKLAVQQDVIDKNPFDKVELPKIRKNPSDKLRFYDREQLLDFVSAANQLYNNDKYMRLAYIYLLCFTGARTGELLALHWSSIDLDNGRAVINKNQSRDANNKLYIVEQTKTKAGMREIYLDGNTLNVLKHWKELQAKQFNDIGMVVSDLLFTTYDGLLLTPSKPYNWIKEVTDQANLPFLNPHGFRHTFITLMVEAGADIKTIQQQVGHADVNTTLNIYAGVTRNQKEQAGVMFADYVKNGKNSVKTEQGIEHFIDK